ncbi:MAG: phospholipase D-like domain-containing protein [Planctomycetota bacterium]|jgi:cardiolipin synthase
MMSRQTTRTIVAARGPRRRRPLAGMAALMAGLLLVGGCRSEPASVKHQKSMAGQVVAVNVDEARADDDEVFIRFQGAVSDMVQLGHRPWFYAAANTDEDLDLVTPMQFDTDDGWAERTAGAPTVPILERDLLDVVAQEIMGELVPQTRGQGVAFRLDLDQVVVYLDDEGQMDAVVIEEKPAEIEVVAVYRPDQIRQMALASFEAHMATRDIEARQILLVTDDVGPGASPFLFVDLDEQQMVFLQLRGRRYANVFEPVGLTADTGAHLVVRSFFLEILRSPFRMAYRSVFFVGYTTADLVNPNSLGGAPQDVPPLYDGPPMDLDEWEEQLNRSTRSKVAPGRVTRYLIDGDEFFGALLDHVSRAEESVQIRTYIFDNDDYGVRLADRLRERSEEVKVKVLVDGLGTIMAATVDSPHMPADFQKPPKIGLYMTRGSKVKYRSQTNPFGFGDHAKTTTIDDRIAFVGGMNIGREYMYEWHDMMAEVEGPVVDIIRQDFHDTWTGAGFFGDWGYFFYRAFVPRIKIDEGEDDMYPVRVLWTTPSESQIYNAQIQAIRRAKRYIYIQNLYWSNTLFLHELVDARQRGVDVRVILPVEGDWAIMNASTAKTANKLFAAGIRVYLFPRLTHVKAAVYDGWACLGSANFDKLSFRVNEEINLGYSDPEAVQMLLDRLFYADFESSVEMTEPFRTDWRNHLAEIMANQL